VLAAIKSSGARDLFKAKIVIASRGVAGPSMTTVVPKRKRARTAAPADAGVRRFPIIGPGDGDAITDEV
jgi:hypothetical protein